MSNLSFVELQQFIPSGSLRKKGCLLWKKLLRSDVSLLKNILFYFFFPLAALLFSLCVGRYAISPGEILSLLSLKIHHRALGSFEVLDTILFRVRLPRIAAAMMIGSALSLAGTVYQSTFRNPMVSPGILGVANGSGFGAAVGILFAFPLWGIQITAFLFGLLAVSISFGISRFLTKEGDSLISLVLTGMVISTIFGSLISLTKYSADPYDKLPAITFWLMGSLASITKDDVLITFVPVVLSSSPLVFLRWKLNLLSFGDDEAGAMGVDIKKTRALIIICSTVMTASCISISGIIGWVGLIVPHICRFICGPDHRKLVPLSMVVGGVYLTFVDNLARTATVIEIPLGIITSLIGAPFFICLMFRKGRSWS
jgi:iron complex transport system permease protein